MPSLEWCQAYNNWVTELIGYPGVMDCKPKINASPNSVIREIHESLASFAKEIHGELEPVMDHPELIGRRFLVYKAYGGNRSRPKYELRVVLDKKENILLWAGGVYSNIINNVPNKPYKQPDPLQGDFPEVVEPPPAPLGQKIIRKPVVYSAEGSFPERLPKTVIIGLYDERGAYPVGEFYPMDEELKEETSDFHCVTGWSVGGIKWQGIPIMNLLRKIGLDGKWILSISHGGYSTIFPYSEKILENAFLVTGMNGQQLPREHGGPYRLIIPRLFGWKSLKWINYILVGNTYLDGYWEARGYHWRGLIVLNERFKNYSNTLLKD